MTSSKTVHIRGEAGQVIAMDLPLPEAIADRLAKGHLQRVNPDGSPIPAAEHPKAGEIPLSRPAVDAPMAEWVGYAVRRHGLTPDEAERYTRQDLIDLDALSAAKTQAHGEPSGAGGPEGRSAVHQQPADASGQQPPPPQPPPPQPPGPVQRPPAAANKAAWVEWAMAAHQLDRETAEAKTIKDLQALPEQGS